MLIDREAPHIAKQTLQVLELLLCSTDLGDPT